MYIFILFLWLFGAIGWVMNIFKLVTTDLALAEFTMLEVCRVIGIFLAPLGSILGLFF